MKIKYTSPIPSAGKTHAIKSCLLNDKGVSVYAAPTIDLIDETYNDLNQLKLERNIDCEIAKITTDDMSNGMKVYGEFTRQFKRAVSSGKKVIFLITHTALINSEIPLKVNAKLYIDEALQVMPDIEYIHGSQSDNQKLLTRYNIGFETFHDSIYRIKTDFAPEEVPSHLILKDQCQKLTDHTTFSKKSDLEILHKIIDPKIDSYYVRGKQSINPTNIIVHFDSVSFLNKFSSVRIVSAYFEYSICYHYLKRLGYQLIPYNKGIDKKRVDKIKSNYELINLFPLLDAVNNRSKEASKTSIIIKGNDKKISLDIDNFFQYHQAHIDKTQGEYVVKDDQLIKVLYNYLENDPDSSELLGQLHLGYFDYGDNTIYSYDSALLKYSKHKLKPSIHNPVLLVYNDVKDTDGTISDGSNTSYQYKLKKCGFYNDNNFNPEDFINHASLKIPYDDNYLRCSSYCFGINQFSNFHNMVFMSSLNYPPQVSGVIKKMLPDYDTTNGMIFEAISQTINRLSIRVPDSKHPVNIIVPSEGIAKILKNKAFFNRCKIHKAPNTSLKKIVINTGINANKRQIQEKERLKKHIANWKNQNKIPTIKWRELIPALTKKWNDLRRNYNWNKKEGNIEKASQYEIELCKFILKNKDNLKYKKIDVKGAKNLLKTKLKR